MSALSRFSPATQAWFRGAFEAPTAAQEGAWKAIADGKPGSPEHFGQFVEIGSSGNRGNARNAL